MKILRHHITGFVVLLTFLCAACETPEDEFEGTVPLEILDVTIPERGQVNSDIEILAAVEAPNGCFKDVKITLRQVNSRYFLLRATSYFKNASACPAVIVSLDTTIVFKPVSAGTYYFQTNEEPFSVKLDTLAVD